jgi:HEXXH motif-containing protein
VLAIRRPLGPLLDIVRLTLPDDGRRYYAPWRGDACPIVGLLQRAHAFVGVTEFWLRLLSEGHPVRSRTHTHS